jgi:hypothetical protein
LSVALDLVLVVDDVALRLQFAAGRDFDREAIADTGERLPDRRQRVVSPFPQGLAINAERPLSLIVLDPVVVADREQPLAQRDSGSPHRALDRLPDQKDHVGIAGASPWKGEIDSRPFHPLGVMPGHSAARDGIGE